MSAGGERCRIDLVALAKSRGRGVAPKDSVHLTCDVPRKEHPERREACRIQALLGRGHLVGCAQRTLRCSAVASESTASKLFHRV